MKYVITGSLGHTSQPIVAGLVKAGHEVTVITSQAERLKDIASLGAKGLAGSVEDESFISAAFKGADALYLMIPPNIHAPQYKDYQKKVADIYAKAVEQNGIKFVVALSSIGAHLGNGAGPIDGVAYLEKKLAGIKGLNTVALRPSYFFLNLLGQAGLIKHMNIAGSNFGNTDEKLVLTDTNDIAEVALQKLEALDFTGFNVQYIASDERHPNEIAKVLGTAVGKPETPWITFPDDQALKGMTDSGFPEEIAGLYVQMGQRIREGKLQEDYWKNRPQLSKVKLEDFAGLFVTVYNN